jgi:hypothetical protein
MARGVIALDFFILRCFGLNTLMFCKINKFEILNKTIRNRNSEIRNSYQID